MTSHETAPSPADRVAHFRRRLEMETDPSDVFAAQRAGDRFVLVDTRSEEAWRQGRILGALHMPTAEIADRASREVPMDTAVVTYCWGPGCNGSTRAALEFALLGYEIREMIGGYEYWVREGLPTVSDAGRIRPTVDPLTAIARISSAVPAPPAV